MPERENRLTRPQTPQNQLRITVGSPLAVQGIFLEVIRERFASDSELGIVWREDLTETDILVETSFNADLEARNAVPAIYVTRISTIPSKIMIGDRVGVHLPDHLEAFGAIMTISFSLECVSNDEGQSAIIGDIVQHMLLASSDVIQATFGLQSMSHPALNTTIPYERDQAKWSSPVTFTADYLARLTTVPIAPLLQQIAQRVTLRGDPNDYFTSKVITSFRRGD